MPTNTCQKCNINFYTTEKSDKLCLSCWKKNNRTCERCKIFINNLPKNYSYCNDCYKKTNNYYF